jgi:hypothetical protein
MKPKAMYKLFSIRAPAVMLAISVTASMAAVADDQQEMGYHVPGQHDALGKPKVASDTATGTINRASAAQTAAYDKYFQG